MSFKGEVCNSRQIADENYFILDCESFSDVTNKFFRQENKL